MLSFIGTTIIIILFVFFSMATIGGIITFIDENENFGVKEALALLLSLMLAVIFGIILFTGTITINLTF